MGSDAAPQWSRVFGLTEGSLYALAAKFGRSRAVVPVRWVQCCGVDPPMVVVALRKGRPIEPIIRDSRAFAVSRLDPREGYIRRKLTRADEHADDPLELIEHRSLVTGSPCLTRALCSLDCEVVRHIDMDGDHELYIGRIVAACAPDPEADALLNSLADAVESPACASHFPHADDWAPDPYPPDEE